MTAACTCKDESGAASFRKNRAVIADTIRSFTQPAKYSVMNLFIYLQYSNVI